MTALKFSRIGLVFLLAGGISLASAAERGPAMTGDSTLIKRKTSQPILIRTQQSVIDRILSFFHGDTTAPATPDPNSSPSPAPIASPGASPSPSADFKVQLWTVREGFQVGNSMAQPVTNVTTWNAQSAIQASAVVSRYSVDQIANVKPDVTVTLAPNDDLMLRQKMTQMSTTSPGKPSSKNRDTCPHWIETDSFYGKRFFCDGDGDVGDAQDFVNTLKQLVK